MARLLVGFLCKKVGLMLSDLNRELFLYINADSTTSSVIIEIARVLSEAPLFLLALLIARVLYRDRREIIPLGFLMGSTAMIALSLSKVLGILLPVDRPFVTGLGNQWLYHSPDPSFPSDHATLLFAIAAACMIRSSWRRVGALAVILGFLNGWARIAVGIHYPYDIAGAFVLSFFCGALVWVGASITKPYAINVLGQKN
ncbi:phosphatase PAP2 family protein [Kiloniella majae]|uniref:phosphatase PAP2 family protein n=1 Tax=Kiloniella majae TaxID=1938558 RepID=UPI000A277D58|nr:phosphatase PAP2 family protein [Kiloniella majae]